MRINILQHTPNEGPGAILMWANQHGHEVYTYHPYQFNKLPLAEDTDMLVVLGGPMSPNDQEPWIELERKLILDVIKADKPVFGACFGAQQIAKVLGGTVQKSDHKEVGFAPVYLKDTTIPNLPKQLDALHWHEECFSIPRGAKLLFSSDLLENQGFIYGKKVVGLQFHFEPLANDLREIVVNDGDYTKGSELKQSPSDILAHGVPAQNKDIMANILDFISR